MSLGLAVALVGVAAVALGHVGDVEPGVIHSCVKNQRGTIRVIGAEGTCRGGETPLDWNAQGAVPGPEFVTVDCANGETVGQALEDAGAAPFVQITINGTCTESVEIPRDDVALLAGPEGGTLAAPSPDASILSLKGARITADGLTLSGGAVGLSSESGGSFRAAGLHITGASQTAVDVGGSSAGNFHEVVIDDCGGEGIAAQGGSHVVVGGGSSITGCNTGLFAGEGGSVELYNAAIADTTGPGVLATAGGFVLIQDTTISNAGHVGASAFGGSITVKGAGSLISGSTYAGLGASNGGQVLLQGARVAENDGGGVSADGGRLVIQDGAIVEDNNGAGVFLELASSLMMQGSIVRGNVGDGIFVTDTSVAEFEEPASEIVDNGGWGILCRGAPAVALMIGDPGTVSGNAAGEINCPSL